MNFFKKLFGESPATEQCPRCLGKGHVDTDDIKRLKMELKWRPGKCAYCKGKGKVPPGTESKVAVDEAFLTADISRRMRRLLFERDERAIYAARKFNQFHDELMAEIIHLYEVENLSPERIAAHYMLNPKAPKKGTKAYERDKADLLDFINKVIQSKA